MVTLKEAEALILQAFRDLIQQGCYGTYGGTCSYLTDEGHSCVIGLALKRKYPGIALAGLEGPAPAALKKIENWGREPWDPAAIGLAQKAQLLHDKASTLCIPLDPKSLVAYARRADPSLTYLLEQL